VALLLWDDHLGYVHNSTLLPSSESSSSFPAGVGTFYRFSDSDDGSGISLDAAAGITKIKFMVDSKLEDQGGVGFAVQDAVVFSATSCLFFNNFMAQYHVAVRVFVPFICRTTDPVQVRKGMNVTSVYIETEDRDSSGCHNHRDGVFLA
jgi:hypothetical protein